MTAATSTRPTPTRVCRWLTPATAEGFYAGASSQLYIAVPRAGGKIDEAVYFVEAVLCQQSGEIAGWKLTRKNADGSWGESHSVIFGAVGGCSCKDAKYRSAPCKHRLALAASLRRVGIAVS